MYLGIDKFENWVTIGIMFIVFLLFLQVLSMFGIMLGTKLGIQAG
jgi:hypothetical protein